MSGFEELDEEIFVHTPDWELVRLSEAMTACLDARASGLPDPYEEFRIVQDFTEGRDMDPESMLGRARLKREEDNV